MQPARVLLLEDDARVRLFVQMALEPLCVDVVPCTTLAQARQALLACGVRLVLTDLALPDGSGLELLQWLQGPDRPPAGAYRTVVFSGGIDRAMERRLEALQVWRVLHKPASVGSLMACVSEALAEPPSAQGAGAVASCDPVADFFAGDRPLYDAYRVQCLAQFAQDLNAGDLAARAGDAAALRYLAHNLKSVLAMLGEAPAAQHARAAEQAAAQGASVPMLQSWQRLRAQLQSLLTGL